ncbi:hypothetical protein CJ030_MR1G023380 [Morella rubra]|uniref:F-box domain-containing protein n=1 Tax=Morella rubra TaxID=262757 RepID=A0A6A1WMS3_9ROSI|nr:hypothetical protein CJ030_MR1G023380 [Morella rubra]
MGVMNREGCPHELSLYQAIELISETKEAESISARRGGNFLMIREHNAIAGIKKHPDFIIRSDDIPSDILFNIFLWLPVKSLLQCRCVSKSWRNQLDCPSLANLHMKSLCNHAAEEPIILLLSYTIVGLQETMALYALRYDGKAFLRARKDPIAKFASSFGYYPDSVSYGLLCFSNLYHGGQAFLFNPARREVLFLPQAKLRGSRGTESWRDISFVPPYLISKWPVSAHRDVHWMVDCFYLDESVEGMIVSFDTKNEQFKLTTHPKFSCRVYRFFYLLELRVSLAIADLSSTTHFEIWVMKDYEKKEWAKEYRINIEVWVQELHPQWRPKHVFFVGAWEHGFYFDMGGNDLFFYNLKTDCLRYVHCPALKAEESCSKSDTRVYSYKGNLVSLGNYGNLMVEGRIGPGTSTNTCDLNTAGLNCFFASVK